MCFRRKSGKRANEIRTNYVKASGHPTYIFAKKGNDYHYMGLTHAEITDGIANIPLSKNPNPADRRKSFFRPKTDSDNKNNFGAKHIGWKISRKDKKKAKKIKKGSQ